jgi:hypothetical protein
MEDQSLQTDVPGRMYAYMVINSPASMKDTELARYWIQRGIKAELSERRRETGENLDLNEELSRALDVYGDRGELESEYTGSNS